MSLSTGFLVSDDGFSTSFPLPFYLFALFYLLFQLFAHFLGLFFLKTRNLKKQIFPHFRCLLLVSLLFDPQGNRSFLWSIFRFLKSNQIPPPIPCVATFLTGLNKNGWSVECFFSYKRTLFRFDGIEMRLCACVYHHQIHHYTQTHSEQTIVFSSSRFSCPLVIHPISHVEFVSKRFCWHIFLICWAYIF